MVMILAFQAGGLGSNPSRRILIFKMKKKDQKVRGQVMAGVGFLMIIFNALDYILGWEGNSTPLFIIGLVLVAVGLRWVRTSK